MMKRSGLSCKCTVKRIKGEGPGETADKAEMDAKSMWKKFIQVSGLPENTEYKAWCFGDDSNGLARLAAEGVKTATASAYPLYALEGEELPKAGEYSVVLNSKEEAVCVIRTIKVYVTPFSDITEEHAYKEGEGDRSLEYWRKVHEAFFGDEMAEAGLDFDEEMKVVCEEFEVVYR